MSTTPKPINGFALRDALARKMLIRPNSSGAGPGHGPRTLIYQLAGMNTNGSVRFLSDKTIVFETEKETITVYFHETWVLLDAKEKAVFGHTGSFNCQNTGLLKKLVIEYLEECNKSLATA